MEELASVFDLVTTENDHRIAVCRTMRGNVAGADSHGTKERHDSSERDRVVRAHLEQQAAHQPRQSDRAKQTEADAAERQPEPFANHDADVLERCPPMATRTAISFGR